METELPIITALQNTGSSEVSVSSDFHIQIYSVLPAVLAMKTALPFLLAHTAQVILHIAFRALPRSTHMQESEMNMWFQQAYTCAYDVCESSSLQQQWLTGEKASCVFWNQKDLLEVALERKGLLLNVHQVIPSTGRVGLILPSFQNFHGWKHVRIAWAR